MNVFVIFSSIAFTIFSTAVLTYVSIATMIGPWIAPLIVLMSSILLKFRLHPKPKEATNKEIALIQAFASVGGIIGIAVGFSLPTLYFLDPEVFNSWLKTPFYFYFFVLLICLIAGGFGIWLARCFAKKFIKEEKLNFPVSQLIYQTITSQSQAEQSKKLFFGFGISWMVAFLRDGFFRFKGFIPKNLYLFESFLGKEFTIAISPMFWSIGFILGIKVVFPLLVGMLSRYVVLYPLNHHAEFLPFKLFSAFGETDFIMAFCSGLVVAELILGLFVSPKKMWDKIKNFSGLNFWLKIKNSKSIFSKKTSFIFGIEPFLMIILSGAFLYYYKFSLLSILCLLCLIGVFTYQISYMGAKLGLVPFGRFATFVMIPMMFLFKLDNFQITVLCVFYSVCAAAASDLLFDYKVGELCQIDEKKIYQYQWFGLIVTSLSIGFFLWLFFTNFQLGSADFFAQRGKSRALLIQSMGFDWRVLILGFLYGILLKKLKINSTMVFGGILMPNSLTIGLMIGAIISWVSKKAKEQQPFWSGVFAGESLWILMSILAKMVR